MTCVTVSRLLRHEIDPTYVLARLGYPDLSLSEWRAMAERHVDPAAAATGILLARDAAGQARGLLLYTLAPRISGAPCLQVERLVSFDVLNPRGVADALVAEVLRLGQRQGCDTLSLVRTWDAPNDATTLVLESGVGVLHQVV